MTIPQQVSSIFEHPFFKQAVVAYMAGNEADLRHLLSEIHIHTYLTVSSDCARAFRLNKRANDPEILASIKDVAPPSGLDLRLPIPVYQEPICRVVPLMVVKTNRRFPKINLSPNQLEFLFPVKTKTPTFLQIEA